MAGDLHTHTNFSDGALDIEMLPILAKRAGLTHLAVTDHDTLLAMEYAWAHPVDSTVKMIPAAELTAFDTKRGCRVHLLCYWPERTKGLEQFCALMAKRRNEATAQSMCELEKLYPQFRREDVQPFSHRSGVVYKTHLIRVLYEYGYTDGIYKELYQQLFGSPDGQVLHDPAYESVETVLAIIREAHGVAVLAHPSVYHSMELAQELAQQGCIDGIELDHPRNTPQDRQTLAQLAQCYQLIVTGGTDFHGIHMKRPVPLGTWVTQDSQLERMTALAQKRHGCV